MAIDAKFKVPPSYPQKFKNSTLEPGSWKQNNSCEAAVVALGVGSLLAVPSAAAAVSAPASRCNGLKDLGEKRLFPRG